MNKLKAIFIVFLYILISANAYTQVKFENISLETAINQANQTGKLVMAQFYSESCLRCIEVAEKAFENIALGNKINENCIALKIDNNFADRKLFIDRYNKNEIIGSFFISGNGDLIYRFTATTSNPATYVTEVEKAINKQVEGLVTVDELKKLWIIDSTNFYVMENSFKKLSSLGLANLDSLLDVYVRRLPSDSLQSPRIIEFLISMSPLIGSKNFNLTRANQQLFNSVWSSLPLNRRIAINNSMISKSMIKAVLDKNIGYARFVSLFAKSTYSNIEEGNHAFELQMLNFYKKTKNDSATILAAIPFYSKYYYSKNISSVFTEDSIYRAKLFAKAEVSKIPDPRNTGKTILAKTVSYVPKAHTMSKQLNEGAWLLYSLSADTNNLKIAQQWAEKGLAFYESPEILDTYARILYKTGQKNTAITQQQKAIAVRKKQGFSTKNYEAILLLMENNLPLSGD